MLLLFQPREELLHSDRCLGSCFSSRSGLHSVVLQVGEGFEHELGSRARDIRGEKIDDELRLSAELEKRTVERERGRERKEGTNLIVAVSIPAVFS